jgi:hypothetical protein
MPQVDAAWSCADLAKAVCDELVAQGLLKEKPAFIRCVLCLAQSPAARSRSCEEICRVQTDFASFAAAFCALCVSLRRSLDSLT